MGLEDGVFAFDYAMGRVFSGSFRVWFVYYSYPWFKRGLGRCTTLGCSLFTLDNTGGLVESGNSFRVYKL